MAIMQVMESFTFDEYHKLQAVADAARAAMQVGKGRPPGLLIERLRVLAAALDALDGAYAARPRC